MLRGSGRKLTYEVQTSAGTGRLVASRLDMAPSHFEVVRGTRRVSLTLWPRARFRTVSSSCTAAITRSAAIPPISVQEPTRTTRPTWLRKVALAKATITGLDNDQKIFRTGLML